MGFIALFLGKLPVGSDPSGLLALERLGVGDVFSVDGCFETACSFPKLTCRSCGLDDVGVAIRFGTAWSTTPRCCLKLAGAVDVLGVVEGSDVVGGVNLMDGITAMRPLDVAGVVSLGLGVVDGFCTGTSDGVLTGVVPKRRRGIKLGFIFDAIFDGRAGFGGFGNMASFDAAVNFGCETCVVPDKFLLSTVDGAFGAGRRIGRFTEVWPDELKREDAGGIDGAEE